MVGISPDSTDKLARFQKQLDVPQRFVSDSQAEAIKAYGVKLVDAGQVYAKRATFVIGRNGKIANVLLEWSPVDNVTKTLDWLRANQQKVAAQP